MTLDEERVLAYDFKADVYTGVDLDFVPYPLEMQVCCRYQSQLCV